MKRFAGIMTAALAVCLFTVGCAGDTGSADNAITVSSAVTAQVAPDVANIAFTVRASGETEEAARAAEDQAASAVVARLAAVGVAQDDVTVAATTVSERFGEAGVTYVPSGYEDWDGNWVETVDEVYYDASGDVVGYDASARVQVSGFAADKLGQVLREAVEAGATDFGGLVYEVDDRQAAYEQALAEAVDAAHEKAETLAKAGGVYVGRVVNMMENTTVPDKISIEADASVIDPSNPATFELIPDKTPVEAGVTVSYAIS